LAKSEDGSPDRSGGGGGEEQEERTDGWMTTYADMVTLLMTFFVLMFAISNVDDKKAMLFFGGLTRNGLSIEAYMEIVERFGPLSDDEPDGEIAPPAFGDGVDPALAELMDMFTSYIEEEGLGDSVEVVFNGDFLMITLSSDILFASASAVVNPEMREIGVVLAHMLRDLHRPDKPFEIVVAGHTDNVPIRTVRYPSNWHVSVDRAVNFLEILIEESELDASYFYARGCGEERPIAPNDTDEGKALNRRVEVMVGLEREDARWGLLRQGSQNVPQQVEQNREQQSEQPGELPAEQPSEQS